MARTSGGKGSSRAQGGFDDRLRQISHCDPVRGRGAGGVHDLGRRAEADYFGSRDVRADLPADVLEGVLEEDCPKWPAKQPAPAAMQRYLCTKAYARGATSATGTSAETRHRRMRAFWLGNMSVSASATARVYSNCSRPRRRRTYGPAGRSAKVSHSSWRRASIFCLLPCLPPDFL